MSLLPEQENLAPNGTAAPQASGSGNVPPAAPPQAPEEESLGGFSGSGLKVQLMPAGEEDEGGGLRKWLIIIFGALLVETVLIGGGYLYMSNQEQVFQERRNELLTTVKANDARIAEAEDTAARAAALGTKASLAEELLDGHLRWTKFFEHLGKRTKKTVTYLSFAGDYASKTVALEAFADSYRDVAEQIVALREDDAVVEVITTSAAASANEIGVVEGVGFSLVVTLEDYMWVNPPQPATESADEEYGE